MEYTTTLMYLLMYTITVTMIGPKDKHGKGEIVLESIEDNPVSGEIFCECQPTTIHYTSPVSVHW